MDEDRSFIGHLEDLASRSYDQNIYTFTEFLGEAELNLLLTMKKRLDFAGITLFGGTVHASRVIARFGKPEELGYEQDFPIVCLKISPLSEKYGEALSHRDYLGALMSLGIRRELLGDIIIQGKNAYLFCLDHIAGYIEESLTQIRHTSVVARLQSEVPSDAVPSLEERTVIVQSERLDAVISKVYNLSRSQSQELFRVGKVFVNGKECDNISFSLKPDEKVSVRGYGKFIYKGLNGTTGKGRCRITVAVFL